MSARRPWAWPLAPLYAAGLAAKDGLRAFGILRTQGLAWPVVSVGSVSAGGAGKTPVAIALAELLIVRGWQVDVLSRGYARSGRDVERVRPDEESAAERYGDEPVLIARRTSVPVWLAQQRFDAGRAAEAEAANTGTRGVHLLDDGFQHRQLARAVDIVLVTEADLDDALLPAGNLREPLTALRRADAVVVRQEEHERVLARVKEFLPAGAAVWTVRRSLSFADAKPVPPAGAGSHKYLAFCAIARPEGLLRDLQKAGVGVAGAVTFPDHYRYAMEDMDKLIAGFDRAAATGFITTEKDAVKLSAAMRTRLRSRGSLAVARLETRFVDEDGMMQYLEAGLK